MAPRRGALAGGSHVLAPARLSWGTAMGLAQRGPSQPDHSSDPQLCPQKAQPGPPVCRPAVGAQTRGRPSGDGHGHGLTAHLIGRHTTVSPPHLLPSTPVTPRCLSPREGGDLPSGFAQCLVSRLIRAAGLQFQLHRDEQAEDAGQLQQGQWLTCPFATSSKPGVLRLGIPGQPDQICGRGAGRGQHLRPTCVPHLLSPSLQAGNLSPGGARHVPWGRK